MKFIHVLLVLLLILQSACSRNDSSTQYSPRGFDHSSSSGGDQTQSPTFKAAPQEYTLPSEQGYERPICNQYIEVDPVTNVKRKVVVYCN